MNEAGRPESLPAETGPESGAGGPGSNRDAARVLVAAAELCVAAGIDVTEMMKIAIKVYNQAHDCPKSPYVRRPDAAKAKERAVWVMVALHDFTDRRGIDLLAEFERMGRESRDEGG